MGKLASALTLAVSGRALPGPHCFGCGRRPVGLGRLEAGSPRAKVEGVRCGGGGRQLSAFRMAVPCPRRESFTRLKRFVENRPTHEERLFIF